MKKIILPLVLILSLAGCITSTKTLEAEKERSFIYRADAFETFSKLKCDGEENEILKEAKNQIKEVNMSAHSKMLAMEYLDLATYEYHEQGDEIDGKYFFYKAVRASKGRQPLPENLENWRVPRKNYEALKWGREDLMEMLDNNGRMIDPVNLAKAQVAYDCWIEEQAEGTDELGTRFCKKEFQDRASKAYDTIESFAEEAEAIEKADVVEEIPVVEEKPVVEEVVAIEEKPVVEGPMTLESEKESEMDITMFTQDKYEVYFNTNYVKPKAGDKEKIAEVAKNFKRGDYEHIYIEAYTDTAGSGMTNQKIAIGRGKAIKKILSEKGVQKEFITFYALGQNNTPGPDGVHNAEYRKVIITFK